MARRLRRPRPRRHPHGGHVRHDQRRRRGSTSAIAVLFVVARRWRCSTSCSIDFSSFSANFDGAGSRGSVALAFSMGAVAALLAGACVAPVVIQVVLFSSDLYAEGTLIALGAPVLPRRRHGDSVADRRRRPGGAAEAGRVDGAREAGVRRRSSSPLPPTTATRRIRSSRIAGWIPAPSLRASKNRSRPDGTRRSPKVSTTAPRERSRCSSTCGPPGARTV